jgi:hypothetical protein
MAESERLEMNLIIDIIRNKLLALNFIFKKPPIIIGGMAMEYYGMRKSGADIDLVICDADYQKLAQMHPEKRKDIYGDFGVVIESFEIWRSIALLDYDFFNKDAIDFGVVKMISIDRLLFSRVSAMDVPKYLDDLKKIKEYYYKNCRNQAFLHEAETHISSYEKNKGETTMTDQEKFEGFKQNLIDENEQTYGKEIRAKYGDTIVDESNATVKGLTKEQYDKGEQLRFEMEEALKAAFETGDPAGELAQKACDLHKQWLCIYNPKYSKEYHVGLGEMYVADERFRANYDKLAPGCTEFLRDAINIYCVEVKY